MAEENLVEGIEADDVYVGNGAAREFPITFTFSNESEVAVFLNGQVIRRGYKVEDGNVVFTIAPANGDVVSILKATTPEYVGGTEKEPEDNGYGNIYIQTDQDQLEVAQIASQVNYVGNGATTDFPTTFSFENSNEVVVYVNSRLVRSGYTVNDEAVVFDEAPANGDIITVLKLDLSEYIEEDEKEEEEKEEESSTVFDQASQEHIKINPVQTKVKYTGNGAVYEFPTIFAFFEDDNVVVYLNGSIINGGYSVSGVGETDGGLVIFDTPPAEGDKIVILRKVVVERVTDFQEGGSFRAKNINDELDRMTAFCQQIEEEMSRCVKVEVTDDQDPKELIDKVFDQLDLATEVGEAAIKTAEETAAMIEGLKETVNAETEIALERVNVAAEDNIEKSRIWAEGEQSEVQELGGELSSRGFADFAYAIANTPEDVPLDQSKLIAMDIVKGPKGDKGDKGEDGAKGEGVEIGDIGIAPFGIDESLNLRRYLNGQIIPLNQFVSFTEKLRRAIELYPNLSTTEENWQAEVTNSKLGQCGKFVIDDTLGTIRLPKVININGLQDLGVLGGIKAESLPNITAFFDTGDRGFNLSSGGAMERSATKGGYAGDVVSNGAQNHIDFDASRVSDAYQDGAPVKQEAVQYPYYIQVALGVEESINITRELELNNPFSLLDYKWSEYELNNASWLLSNGNFHSGSVYKSAYELLTKIKNGVETKGGVNVKLSTEGYSDTDFVINTEEQTFRLPLKVADLPIDGLLKSTIPVRGNGKGLVLSDGSNQYGIQNDCDNSSCAWGKTSTNVGAAIGSSTNRDGSLIAKVFGVTTDASKSGIIADFTKMSSVGSNFKLYFYVGETVQDANLIDTSKILTELSKKFDKDDINDYVVESYRSGTNWYRVYKSGWIEQGGISGAANLGTTITISFLKPYSSVTNYFVTGRAERVSSDDTFFESDIDSYSTTSFRMINRRYNGNGTDTFRYRWFACGQGA